jgi:hypothetical protein
LRPVVIFRGYRKWAFRFRNQGSQCQQWRGKLTGQWLSVKVGGVMFDEIWSRKHRNRRTVSSSRYRPTYTSSLSSDGWVHRVVGPPANSVPNSLYPYSSLPSIVDSYGCSDDDEPQCFRCFPCLLSLWMKYSLWCNRPSSSL